MAAQRSFSGTLCTKIFAQPALVEADFLTLAVDVHFGDGALDRLARLLSQAEAGVEWLDSQSWLGLRHPA